VPDTLAAASIAFWIAAESDVRPSPEAPKSLTLNTVVLRPLAGLPLATAGFDGSAEVAAFSEVDEFVRVARFAENAGIETAASADAAAEPFMKDRLSIMLCFLVNFGIFLHIRNRSG